MKFLFALPLLFSIAVILSCNTPQHVSVNEKAQLDSWVGSTREGLIKNWGRPTKETPDGQGGEIITYDTTIVTPKTPGTTYNNGNRGIDNYAVDNYVLTKSRIFYINPKAIIYRWEAKERQGY